MEHSSLDLTALTDLLSRAAHRRAERRVVPGRTAPQSQDESACHENHHMNSGAVRAPVNFKVTGANAFELLIDFSRAARAAGWTKIQIDETVDQAMSGDYEHLQCTLAAYTTGYLAGN